MFVRSTSDSFAATRDWKRWISAALRTLMCVVGLLVAVASLPVSPLAQVANYPPPKGIEAESTEEGIRLSWKPVGDRADEVVIHRISKAGSEVRLIRKDAVDPSLTNRRTMVDSEGLVEGTRYRYQILVARRTEGPGSELKTGRAANKEVTFTGREPSPPSSGDLPAPTNVQATAGAECVTLTWEFDEGDLPSSVTKYQVRIHRRKGKSGSFNVAERRTYDRLANDEPEKEFFETQLQGDSQYYYYISVTPLSKRAEARSSTRSVYIEGRSEKDIAPPKFIEEGDPVRVMTWNLYIGAPVTDILRAAKNNVDQLPTTVHESIERAIGEKDFRDRADEIAEAILERQPHVVGLQEVPTIYREDPGYWSGNCGRSNDKGTVVRDHLSILMDAIGKKTCRMNNDSSPTHLGYRVASVYSTTDGNESLNEALEFPEEGHGTARLVDRNVILVREDVQVMNSKSGKSFSSLLQSPVCISNRQFCGNNSDSVLPCVENLKRKLKDQVQESVKNNPSPGPGSGLVEIVANHLMGQSEGDERSGGDEGQETSEKGFYQPIERGYHSATIRVKGKKYTITNTHLEQSEIPPLDIDYEFIIKEINEKINIKKDVGPFVNLSQQFELMGIVGNYDNKIVIGDFNRSHKKVRNRWKEYRVINTRSTHCWPQYDCDERPPKQIDHILIDRGIDGGREAKAKAFNAKYKSDEYVSDHRGIYAEFPTEVNANQPPIAEMDAPSDVQKGRDVRFSARPSRDPDGTIRQYQWIIAKKKRRPFGDRWIPVEKKDGETAEFGFSSTGTYRVGLQVKDNRGARSSTSRTFDVNENALPDPDIDGKTQVVKNRAITLSADDSEDPDGTIQQYKWNVDGPEEKPQKSGEIVSYSFRKPGNYTATVTVTDNQGASASTEYDFVVKQIPTNHPPQVEITGPNRIPKNQSKEFRVTEVADPDGRIVEYSWDAKGPRGYNDGKEGTNISSGDTFTPDALPYRGTYTVTLTVVDNDGGTATASTKVTVRF